MALSQSIHVRVLSYSLCLFKGRYNIGITRLLNETIIIYGSGRTMGTSRVLLYVSISML